VKTSWLQKAECRSLSTDLFMPSEHKRMSPKKCEKALRICEQCSVVKECALDLVYFGDIYKYQIRANRRLWIDSDLSSLPSKEEAFEWQR
jgi:hypothetical protein